MTTTNLDLKALRRELDRIQARWAEIQSTPQPGLVTDRLICAEQSAADVPFLIRTLGELTAELVRVDAAFSDAVAEISELYAERDATRAVIHAAKAWRNSDDVQTVGLDDEGMELVAAIDALPAEAVAR